MKNNYDVITISHFFYPRVGGLEAMAYDLVKYLSQMGNRVLAIYGGPENKSYNYSDFHNIQLKLWSLFGGTYPIAGPRFIAVLIKKLWQNPKASVFIHDRHLLTSLAAAAVCKLLGRKYTLVSHTTISNYFRSSLLMRIGNILEKTLFKFVVNSAYKVICVSNTNQKYLVENLGLAKSKSSVIYNGFNTLHISKYRVQPKQKIVVFATKWILVKDPDTTALAFIELAGKHPDWKFYFIGQGESILQNLEGQNLPANLLVENRLFEKDELYELLSRSYIYVNSSLNEGLSVGVLEAAALGNRLVLSDAPSNLEVAKSLQQLSFSFERGDVAGLVRSVDKAVANFTPYSAGTNRIINRAYKYFASEVVFALYGSLVSSLQAENVVQLETKLTKAVGIRPATLSKL